MAVTGKEASSAALRRLARLGLARRVVVAGFELDRVDAGEPGALLLCFTRGAAAIGVRLAVVGRGAAGLARVGKIDVAHAPVVAGLERHAGELARAVASRLERHAADASLDGVVDEPRAPSPVTPIEDEGAYAGPSEAPDLDPERETPVDGPFLRFPVIDVTDVTDAALFPRALREMYEGTLGGLVLRGAYDPAFMRTVTDRLVLRDADFPRTSFPARFKAHFYGRCLDGSTPELTEYLDDAARFRAELGPVFEGGAPFEARMEAIFAAMSGGARVELPRFTDGRAYTPATIRILLEGGQIGTHCGNEASTRPAYTHLNGVLDRHDQLSFFLTLDDAIEGGELIVYSLKWSDIDASRIVHGRSSVDDLVARASWLRVRPRPGDLLIFDGGRYFHRVSKVIGARSRWTIGGFMMFSSDGERLLYWS